MPSVISAQCGTVGIMCSCRDEERMGFLSSPKSMDSRKETSLRDLLIPRHTVILIKNQENK